MMLQSVNNNTQPTFGMALRKPANTEATRAFAKYVKTNDFCINRGLKRFIKAQKNNRFDIVHNAANNSVEVLNLDGTVKKAYAIGEKVAETANQAQKKRPNILFMTARGLWLAATQPEHWLPIELKKAGKYATRCEQEAIAEAKAAAKAKRLEEKAIAKTEQIFDSVK